MSGWSLASATDVGRVRSANEDSLGTRGNLAVVADGMGGHAAGEVASGIAVATFLDRAATATTLNELTDAVRAANMAILDNVAENPDRWGMGTTLVATALIPHEDGVALAYVHVGDSRIYLVREGAIRQVTDDHSVADEMVRLGRLTPEEAAVDPRRHQLTRALGTERDVAIDSGLLNAQPGDFLILCSDGLSNEVSDHDMIDIVESSADLDLATARLIDQANSAGGRDNISVVIAHITEQLVTVDEESRRPAEPAASTFAPSASPGLNKRRTVRRRWPVVTVVALVLALILGGGYQILNWWYYSSYYLTLTPQGVTLYQGQTTSVLWFHANEILAEPTLTATNLRPADIASLTAKMVEPTSAAAISQINYFKTYALISGQG